MFFFRTLVIAVLFGLVTVATSAATLESANRGHWTIGAYSDDATGQFSHCGMLASYQNGVSLLFAVDKQYGWRMGLVAPNWNLTPGSQYDITYRVDNLPMGSATAVAVTAQQVLIELQPSSALYRQFQSGQRLTIIGSGQTLYFNLAGTHAGLSEILSCVQRYTKTAAISLPSTNPFVAPAQTNNSPAQTNSSNANTADTYHAEAVTLAANLLSQAGISGFRLLGASELPEIKGVDAVWVAPGLIGTVKVNGDPKFFQQDAQGLVLAQDSMSCKGKFASGSVPPSKSGGTAIQLFTVCDAGNNTTPINYTIAKRPAGGVYIMSVVGLSSSNGGDANQGAELAREASERIRDASNRVLGN